MGNPELLITDEELQADLAQLNAEAMGWLPLETEEGGHGYLHVADPDALVIDVVGVADAGMAGMNVLWVG